MEKTGQMIEFEEETGQSAIVTVKVGFAELQFPSEAYVQWVEYELLKHSVKATAYGRIMSGGRKTLKEWANIFGAYFAVGKSGVGYVFRDNPPLVENTFMGQCLAIVYPEFIDFSGDWTTSLTLPDGWEDKNGKD